MNLQNGKIALWVWIAAALIIIAAGLAWYFYYQTALSPVIDRGGAPLSGGDTTSDIEGDLGAVDLGNLNQDFDSLDKDLNSF